MGTNQLCVYNSIIKSVFFTFIFRNCIESMNGFSPCCSRSWLVPFVSRRPGPARQPALLYLSLSFSLLRSLSFPLYLSLTLVLFLFLSFSLALSLSSSLSVSLHRGTSILLILFALSLSSCLVRLSFLVNALSLAARIAHFERECELA
jgi:hypothetical protein